MLDAAASVQYMERMKNKTITPYFEQLRRAAGTEPALIRAFEAAGVPSSTFYRARLGKDLHVRTAQKVANQIVRGAGTNERTRDVADDEITATV